MKPEEFLTKLNKLPEESRGSFSTIVLSLSKIAAAEAIRSMLKDNNFAVRVNAIKAIRKHQLKIYEKELMQSLLEDSFEIKIAAIKTIASFGDFKHYKLLKAFYDENQQAKSVILDSFSNYSDNEEVYYFILSQITSKDEKVIQIVKEWFKKAFEHDVLLPWIINAYISVPFEAKRVFEKTFLEYLPKLFYDNRVSYRLKLNYLLKKRNDGLA
ncbi:MAG: hypothetical protein QG567_63 [Campylobacterota bacterium]|nr:hypothetical protein [Campylobacterota bacterium]